MNDFLQALKYMRRDWRYAKGRHVQHVWDHVVAFLIPGTVYRWWMKWIFRPVRYHVMPWYIDSEVLECPLCSIAFLEGEDDTRHEHYGHNHPSYYNWSDDEDLN